MIILTRQQANNLSDNLVGIMTEIEDELLRKIAAQIARDNDISDTSKWRMRQLARMGQLDKEALRLIKSYSRIQSDVLYDTLMNAALTEIGYVDAGMREAAAKGLISGDMTIPADRTAENALKAYYKQAQSDLNMVNTVMGYQATAAYTGAVNNIYYQVHNALDTGTATVVMGDESLQSAIRQTIHNLSRNGIPAFVDRGGHHWSPEAYVRMDLRTTVGNTARAAQWSRCDNFGVSLIAVDSHPGARPKCAPYQGRIFSRDGSSGTTTDGSGREITYSPLSSTSYGEPDGLFGINCGHSCYPFIPGVNFQRYFPYDPEENAARYKEFQTQRALEREIRASKRECMMLQAAGDKEGYEKAALRLRTQREKYRVYSNEHGLSLHNDRTQVYGFDRSQSMKAVWAEKKAKKVKSAPPSGSSGGHAVTLDVPANPIHQQIKQAPVTKPTFKNAESIEEAQAYARSIGVEHPDYSKFSLERANNMNIALSTLPDDSMPYVVTDLQKYTSVTGAPLGKAQKNGYACTVTPYEIDLQRAGIADIPRTVGSGNTIVAVNTRNYKTIDSITESKAKSEEIALSRNLGKSYHFNKDGKATDFHECGHIYEAKHGIPTGFSAYADQWYKETGCIMLKTTSEAWAEAYAAYYTHADDLPPYIRRYFDKGEWKDNSGSKVLSLDEWYRKLLDKSGESGINRS